MQTITRPHRPPVAARAPETSLPTTVPIGRPTPLGVPSALRPDVLDRPGHRAKRVLDIAITLLALIILGPLMVLVAIVVKLSSPGPVFFRQERVGRNGQAFCLVKFRSMRHGAHADLVRDAAAHRRYQENGFKVHADDPMITSVGRFIRATSLDELPQLFNVLGGDMSIVGIRPVVADQLALRSDYDQACYRAMRPGMTGLWQVSGRSSLGDSDRHALDREYVESWSVANDLHVLLRTPIAVFRIADTR